MSRPASTTEAPVTIRITPGPPEPTLRLLRETFATVLDHPADAERVAWAVMRQLAGTILRMPTLADIERLARDEAIVRRFTLDPSGPAVQHAAAHHGAPVREVARVFKHRRGGRGLQHERARRSTTPGLTCRVPRLSRWRNSVLV